MFAFFYSQNDIFAFSFTLSNERSLSASFINYIDRPFVFPLRSTWHPHPVSLLYTKLCTNENDCYYNLCIIIIITRATAAVIILIAVIMVTYTYVLPWYTNMYIYIL